MSCCFGQFDVVFKRQTFGGEDRGLGRTFMGMDMKLTANRAIDRWRVMPWTARCHVLRKSCLRHLEPTAVQLFVLTE